MAELTSREIRTNIAGLITSTLSVLDSLPAPKAKVANRWISGSVNNESLAAMKSVVDSNKIHAFMVRRVKTGFSPKTNVTEHGEWLFQIRGVLEFNFGDDSNNSEDTFDRELDALITGFNGSKKLQFNNNFFVTHDGLTFTKIEVQNVDSKLVHLADAELLVRVIQQIKA